MTPADLPFVRDLVLVGGGHAHALVLRLWGMKPLAGVRLTLINPGPAAPYTGMLPGLVAGHYPRDALMIDLVRLARFSGARIILDRATGIDLAAREVLMAGRAPVRFDVASLDIGILSDLPDLPGFMQHAHAAKPLGNYATAWDAFVAKGLSDPHVVIFGGGVGGVELALASAYRLRASGAQPTITVLERGPQALTHLGAATRNRLLAELAAAGIDLRVNTTATEVTAMHLILADGRTLRYDFTLSVAGARPHGWLQATGLTLTDGYVRVGPTLQSSDPSVFAVGDTAHLSHAPRPKAGVFAVREAPVLHHNLRAALTGGRMRRYQPQGDYLKLISTGDRRAVADKSGLRTGGAWLWRMKDRIDRRFMAKFEDFPAMPLPSLPRPSPQGLAEAIGNKPLCGGCGAKVGADTLLAALKTLPAPRNPEVLSGPGDDAAILRTATGVQVITTDHLRAFLHDPRRMAELAAIHALGDIWAMGAAPQVALAQITLPRASANLHADMLAEVMSAASAVFSAAGADIVGGHTSVGAELTIGFTVTGLAQTPVTKAGATPGCALILTKPIGTGIVLAAEMALTLLPGLILGEAVATCLDSMAQPQGTAAAILAPEAGAMTDVTGFGLAGHLLEIAEASGCAVSLNLADLPRLPAAAALAAAGIASTLAPANRLATAGRIKGPDDPLIYDPQTCGGLLAAVPAARAATVLATLHAAGIPAAIIGATHPGPPQIICHASGSGRLTSNTSRTTA